MLWIESEDQEVTPFRNDQSKRQNTDHTSLQDVCPCDAKHIAKENMIEMNLRLNLGIKNNAQTKHPRKNNTHHRVLFYSAILREIACRHGTKHPGKKGADR